MHMKMKKNIFQHIKNELKENIIPTDVKIRDWELKTMSFREWDAHISPAVDVCV